MSGLGNGGFGSISIQGQGWQAVVGTLANIVVRLAFVLVMLYFAIKSGDYFEVAGASIAKNWGNSFGFSMPSWLLRNTLGRGAGAISNKLPNEGPGRFAKAPLNLIAQRSYDPRSLPSRLPGIKDVIEKEFGKPTGKGGISEDQHHRDAELKKAVDAEVKKINEHGGGAAAEIREQAKFQREYDRKYGTGALNKKVKDLTQQLEHFRHESVEIAKRGVEATDKAGRDAAARELKEKQTEIKTAETQLKAITSVGKKVADDHKKEHVQEIALRYMASGNVKKYMIGQKLLNGKSSAEKLKDAAKEASKEDDDAEKGGDHGDGGGAAPAASHGTTPHAPPAH